MCNVSKSIKLCTCKASFVNRLQHYWQVYRINKDKNEIIVGEVVLPYEMIDLNYKANQTTLVKRVNETAAFDVPMAFQNKDILEIVFNNQNYYKRTVYGFQYNKGRWNRHEIDSSYLIGHFDEMEFGKIKK